MLPPRRDGVASSSWQHQAYAVRYGEEELGAMMPRAPPPQMQLAMSFALPALAPDTRGNGGAAPLFAFHALGQAGASGSTSGSGSTQQGRRPSQLDMKSGGDAAAALGHTFRGAGALAARSHSPPASPMLSPIKHVDSGAQPANPLAAARDATTAARASSSPTMIANGSNASRASLSISALAVHPGHVALSFQRGTVFCVLDSTTDDGDLSDGDEERLRAFLRRTAAQAGAQDAFHSTATPMLALRTVDSSIIALIFLPQTEGANGAVPLRLLIVQQNATFLIWEYAAIASGSSRQWQYVSRGVLPLPLPESRLREAASSRFVSQVVLHVQQRTLVWMERMPARTGTAFGLFATQLPVLGAPQLPDVLDQSRIIRTHFSCPASSASAANALATSPATVLLCGERGVLVAPVDAVTGQCSLQQLYYFSLQTLLLLRIPVPQHNGASDLSVRNGSQPVLLTAHPHTRHLVGVDGARRVLRFEERPVDQQDPSLNLFDSDLYVRVAAQCVLDPDGDLLPQQQQSKPAHTYAHANGRSRASFSRVDSREDSAAAFLPTGSHLVAFRHYLALLRPTGSAPGAPASTPGPVRCAFFLAVGGGCLASFVLQERDHGASAYNIDEDDEDELDSPAQSSPSSSAGAGAGGLVRGVAATTHGFGGSGVCVHSQRSVWWLRMSPITNQVAALTRKRDGVAAQGHAQPALADAVPSVAARDLQRLIQASQSLIPSAIGLMPPSVSSSPVLSYSSGNSSALPSLSVLDSPLLVSSSAASPFISDTLPSPQQSHLAARVLAPFGQSVAPLATKHQASAIMGSLLARSNGRKAPAARRPASAFFRLGEDNLPAPNEDANGPAEEMKEGGGEGQQHQQHSRLGEESKECKSDDPAALMYAGAASGASELPPATQSLPQLIRTLQSPALAISMFHLPTSMPSAFSDTGALSHPSAALLAPAFSGVTYDAQLERLLRDEIARYLRLMQPLTVKQNRRKLQMARAASSNTSFVQRRTAVGAMNGSALSMYDAAPEDIESGDSEQSSSASSSVSNSPLLSPASASPAPRGSILLPRAALNGASSSSFSSSSSAAAAAAAAATGRAARSQLRVCFQLYTPLSLQTLPLIQQYAHVMRALRRLKHGGLAVAAAPAAAEEGKEGQQLAVLEAPSSSHAGSQLLHAHPATYIPPLPSLQQQLSKAITNRLTKLAAGSVAVGSPFSATPSADRSFTSLVLHDAASTLAYLTHVLGLQGLQQLVDQQASSSSSSSLQRVMPNLLLVNEENKLRKELSKPLYPSRSASSAASDALATLAQMSRLDSLPYFETIVRLFDQLAPQLLPAFVRVMDDMFSVQKRQAAEQKDAAEDSSSSSSSSSEAQPSAAPALRSVLLTPLEMESHVERALRILAPILSTPPSSRPPLLHRSHSSGNGRMAAGETSAEQAPSALFETDGSHEAGVGEDPAEDDEIAAVAASSLQSHKEQLRLERISARCSLLVQSGRPVEAVLLRLRMADEDRDSSQEDAAIALAGAIVRDQESAALGGLQRRGDGAEDPEERVAESLLPRLSPVYALRDELFHHLFTHWLQRQFSLQYAAQQDSNTAAANLSLASLPVLDPRVRALMSPNFGVTAYLELIDQEKRRFVQTQAWKNQELMHRQPTVAQSVSPQPSASPQLQHWPVLSPLLLPSPATAQSAAQAAVHADAPMSCMLAELKHFVAQA